MHGSFLVYMWTPYPEVNVPELDVEHRALGATVRQMLEAMRNDDPDRALSLGRELARKAGEHFAHEERLMRDIGYANEARHARTHEGFLGEARLNLDILRKRGLCADVLRWAAGLDEWFHRHVRTEDMWLALALNRTRTLERSASAK